MTADRPDLNLDGLREKAEKATPGPWFRQYGDVITQQDDPRDRYEDEPRPARVFQAADHLDMRDQQAIADADFVVAARSDVLALIARVEKAEGAVARVDALMDEWDRPGLPADVNPFVNRLVRRTRRALGADS